MTTTNNHLTLIDQVGGIEKAKAIIKGVPDGMDTYCCETGGYFKQLPIMKPCVNCIYLNYLRTAIAQHDSLSNSSENEKQGDLPIVDESREFKVGDLVVDAVIMGHTVTQKPFKRDNCYYIDTGAVHWATLTILDLETV